MGGNKSELTLNESQALVASGERVDLMLKWKQEGKLRWCGITTHSEQPEWLSFVAESKLYDMAVVGFNYRSPSAIVKAMEDASRQGIGLIGMKTQSPDYADGEHKIGAAPNHRKALNWVLSKPYVTAADRTQSPGFECADTRVHGVSLWGDKSRQERNH